MDSLHSFNSKANASSRAGGQQFVNEQEYKPTLGVDSGVVDMLKVNKTYDLIQK